MATVTILNTQDGTGVEVHGKGCKDIKRKLKDIFNEEVFSMDSDDVHEVWKEYNADFIAEGSGTWGMTTYPCTGFAEKKFVYDGK